MEHPGWCALQAAGIEVERRQVRPEVDVQPLAPGRLGVPQGTADQRGGNVLPLMVAGDLREHGGAGHPKYRTASDGFDTDRARLLIGGTCGNLVFAS
jgi:hypothetical protein